MTIYLTLACSTVRNAPGQNLHNTNWELEHLSPPEIAFDKLFPDRIPHITFKPQKGKVEGNVGCNGYAAVYEIIGGHIGFGEPDPSTMMYCGEGKKLFLNTMKDINRYAVVEGKLNLMIDDKIMMRFKQGNSCNFKF